MKHVIPLESAFITSFTNSEELQEMIPEKITPYLAEAQQEREWQRQEIEVLGRIQKRTGCMKRIATPEFGRGRGLGREKFFRWLKEHPEWDATGKVGR
jgi:predicted fused transcriptional regulator/phosphomethylpyrimidine kinase